MFFLDSTDRRQLSVLYAKQYWLGGFAVDVHFGIERDARKSVLVFDCQAADVELPAAHILAGQVALDGSYALAGELHATQEREISLGSFQESNGVNVGVYEILIFFVEFIDIGHEVADEYLAGQSCINHTRQLYRHIPDDEVMHGWIEAFRLVKFVAAAYVKAGAQARYGFGI